ncbi:MAG: hypothetical protein KAS32_04740 [Candidatus Peribacteraceae bacterium]|nr:hypothetical protein [Candidatus Peribacteraceae bacterium]
MATVKDLIKFAHYEIGVQATGESLSADDEQHGFDILNMMLGTWGNKRNRIFTTEKESFSLVVGQVSYTIGTGGEFNTERPTHIEQAYIQDSGGIDYPVEVLEDRTVYELITDKDIDARPFQLYFERSFTSQRGQIFFNRAPTTAETVFLIMWKPFAKFSTKTETIVMPDGYERAIYTQLAIELAPSFGKAVSAELVAKAKDALDSLDDTNIEVPEMASDAPARTLRRGHGYNINSDGFN